MTAQILEFGACQQKADEAADAARIAREAGSADAEVLTVLEQLHAHRRIVNEGFTAAWKMLGARPFDEIFADHAERTAMVEGV